MRALGAAVIGLSAICAAIAGQPAPQSISSNSVGSAAPPSPAGTAKVYVYRRGFVGLAIGWPVFINGEFLTKLRHSKYVLLEIPQGTLVLSSQCSPSATITTLHMPGIDVKAGQTYYVRMSMKIMTNNKTQGCQGADTFMSLVDEKTGASEIRGSKPAPDVRRLDDLSLMDQAQLARLALEGPDSSVRVDAFKRLAGRTQLATLALGENDEPVRAWGAAQSRADQALLAKLAVESKDAVVRVGAVGKMTDQTLLAKVAMEGTDSSVRLSAVDRLRDQALLAKVAMESTDPSVRLSAVDGLKDQALLAKDQALLAKVATESTGPSFRLSAADRLTDQTMLARLATERVDPAVRVPAVQALKGQALLARLALESVDPSVRLSAVGGLTDQTMLVRLATESTDASVRAGANRILADQALLAKLMVEGNGTAVCAVVTNYLGHANYKTSGWQFSDPDTTFAIETTDSRNGVATVTAQVAFKAGTGAGMRWSSGARAFFDSTIGPANPLQIYGVEIYPKDGAMYMIMPQKLTFFLAVQNGFLKLSGRVTPPKLADPADIGSPL
ncbi:MAG: DUF2846 domain-containing protein [Bryobacteraceae bacterium]